MLKMYYGDLTDGSNINRILEKVKPDEIYNLGAQSHVKVSFELPEYTADTVALGTLRLLDAVRDTGLLKVKFYQAGSSEMFGKVRGTPQKKLRRFIPEVPMAVLRFLLIIWRLIIGSLMVCLFVMVYYLIMNHRAAAELL